MKKSIKLYDIVFPLWVFFLFPLTMPIALALNFFVDSLVFYIAARFLKLENKGFVWRKSILKIWLLGFLSDIIGALLNLVLYFIIAFNPYEHIHNVFLAFTLISIPGIILAGYLIYLFGKKFYFSKTNLSDEQIKKLSLTFAIFTAPYLMMIQVW